MNVYDVCIAPFKHEARIADDVQRQAVIDVLERCWPHWDYFTKCVYKHNSPQAARSFRDAMTMMGDEQLASLLYDVHDNGDLVVNDNTIQ